MKKVSPSARRGQAATPRLSGIDRVLVALKRLAAHPRGTALDDLAREIDAPKSSVHRALAHLCYAGLAERRPAGRYHLGYEFLRLAFAHHQGLDERALVEPVMQALADRFGEASHFARLDGHEVVYLAIVKPTGSIQMSSTVGGRNPAHCTAVGKALLAWTLTDRAAVDAYIARHGPLAKPTPRALVGGADLHRELELSRRRGYAVDDQEGEPGVNCLAMPLLVGPTAEPLGAISVSAVAQRTPLARLVARAADLAGEVRARLGPASIPAAPWSPAPRARA